MINTETTTTTTTATTTTRGRILNDAPQLNEFCKYISTFYGRDITLDNTKVKFTKELPEGFTPFWLEKIRYFPESGILTLENMLAPEIVGVDNFLQGSCDILVWQEEPNQYATQYVYTPYQGGVISVKKPLDKYRGNSVLESFDRCFCNGQGFVSIQQVENLWKKDLGETPVWREGMLSTIYLTDGIECIYIIEDSRELREFLAKLNQPTTPATSTPKPTPSKPTLKKLVCYNSPSVSWVDKTWERGCLIGEMIGA